MSYAFLTESRYSPHNCTVCLNFDGALEFLSDTRPEMSGAYDCLWLDCKQHGKRINNNFLRVCDDFVFDSFKDSLVYDPDYRKDGSRRHYVRVKKNDSSGLDSIIYDLVARVTGIDDRGYMTKVCVHRVHNQTGISREAIFREIMNMIETGLLIRYSIEGAVFLRPPSPVLNIGDLKRK